MPKSLTRAPLWPKRLNTPRPVVSVAARLALLCAPLAAAAQAPAEEGALPEVITVTGTGASRQPGLRPAASAGFGDQTVLDTPYSISVLTADQLRDQGIVTIEQALKFVPGATPSYASGAYNYFNVRGNIPANLIDGAPYWGRARYSLENVERIEFLKGPAALRGGFGGPGGALNLVTKRAGATPSTDIDVSVDSWGAQYVSLDAGRRTDDGTFGSRVNLAYERLDDQWNLRGERSFASIANDLRVSDTLRLRFDLDVLDDQRVYSGEYNTDTEGRVLALDPERLYGQPWADQHTQAFTARFGADWQFAPAWTARLQLGAYRYRELWNATYMAPVQSDGRYELYWLANRGLRRGLNLTGSVTGTVQTGAWQHDVTLALQHARSDAAVAYSDFELLGISSIFQPVVFPRRAVDGDLGEAVESRETSLIATDEIHFDPRWSVLAGARYSRYQTEANNYATDAALPIAALLYKPAPTVTTYLSYAASLEPGGTAPADASNRGEQLDARRSRQLELGAKWSALDARLLLTASVFAIRADYYGYTNAEGRYVQDGYQDLEGLEFGIDGRIAPGWTVQGGVSWLRGILQDTGDAVQDGRQSPGVPRSTASLTLTHDLAALPGLALTGGVYHTGWFDTYNYDLLRMIRLPSTTTADAGLRYRWTIGTSTATARLQLNNLFDRNGWQPYFYPLQPRTAKLSFEFGF